MIEQKEQQIKRLQNKLEKAQQEISSLKKELNQSKRRSTEGKNAIFIIKIKNYFINFGLYYYYCFCIKDAQKQLLYRQAIY